MAELKIGHSVRPALSPQETVAQAERIQALVMNEDFAHMLEDAADAILREWFRATTTAHREELWYRLQGIEALLKQMRAAVDQGLRASK